MSRVDWERRWNHGIQRDIFAFRREEDAVMFALLFSGE